MEGTTNCATPSLRSYARLASVPSNGHRRLRRQETRHPSSAKCSKRRFQRRRRLSSCLMEMTWHTCMSVSKGSMTLTTRSSRLHKPGRTYCSRPAWHLGGIRAKRILVQVGTIRPFSDIAGRHVVRLSNAAQQRHELANRLQVAGCKVDQSGQDWYSAGNFDVEEPKISPSLHEVQPKAVSEIEEDPDVVRVLIRIGEKPGMFTADIQDITKLNRIKAQYCIDVLKKNLTLSTNSNGLM
jgi:hypothetical protein